MKPDFTRIASLLEELATEFWKLDPDYQLPKDFKEPELEAAVKANFEKLRAPEPVKAKETELSDLQAVGRKLIQDSKQVELKAFLTAKGLKSLSTAPATLYKELLDGLNSL